MLHKILVERGVQSVGYRTAEVKQRLAAALDDSRRYELEPGTVDAREVCRLLDEVMPREIGLITGGGANVVCHDADDPASTTDARQSALRLHRPGSHRRHGAVVAIGKQPAFLMEGDTGLMMHLAEFETMVRYGRPLMVVIMNDQAPGSEYYKGLKPELAKISTPDLRAVGRSLGGRGSLVTELGGLRAAAEEFVASPAPKVIDVRISSKVISIPYRRLWFGEEA